LAGTPNTCEVSLTCSLSEGFRQERCEKGSNDRRRKKEEGTRKKGKPSDCIGLTDLTGFQEEPGNRYLEALPRSFKRRQSLRIWVTRLEPGNE
jgi:hypothetical protein